MSKIKDAFWDEIEAMSLASEEYLDADDEPRNEPQDFGSTEDLILYDDDMPF